MGAAAGRRRSGCRNGINFSTDANGATEDFARSGTDLLECVARVNESGERLLIGGEAKAEFGAAEFPAMRVLDQLAEKFLLRLDGGFDCEDLLERESVDRQGVTVFALRGGESSGFVRWGGQGSGACAICFCL